MFNSPSWYTTCWQYTRLNKITPILDTIFLYEDNNYMVLKIKFHSMIEILNLINCTIHFFP